MAEVIEFKNARERLRAAALGKHNQFKTEKFEYNGETFEVRQPSVAKRSLILEKARLTSRDTDEKAYSLADLQVWGVILLVYAPGEDQPVFSEADYETLISEPTGGFVDTAAPIVMKLMNVSETEAQAKNG